MCIRRAVLIFCHDMIHAANINNCAIAAVVGVFLVCHVFNSAITFPPDVTASQQWQRTPNAGPDAECPSSSWSASKWKKARFNEDTSTLRSAPAVVISAHDRWQIFVLCLFCLILCPLCFHSQSSRVAKYKLIVELVICKVTT